MTMKRMLPLLFALFLFTACAPSHGTSTQQTLPPETQPASLYAPGSDIERSTQGAVTAYPLPIPDVYGIRPMGEDFLIFSGSANTTLTKLRGHDLYIAASATLGTWVSHNDATLNIQENGLSYFDPQAQETVVLDTALQETRRIAAPETRTGKPILSADGTTLYYCTADSLRAWDLSSGIRRMVKEMDFPSQEVTALHKDDAILQCFVTDENGQKRTLFLSTENGLLLAEKPGEITLFAEKDRYYAVFRDGILQTLLFGTLQEEPSILLPADLEGQTLPLAPLQCAVTITEPAGNTIQLDYYDLNTGLRTASLTYPSPQKPIGIEAAPGGSLLILTREDGGQSVLYLWDTEKTGLNDAAIYTDTYFTADAPDLAGLSLCQAYADKIGDHYGIEVKIWQDATEILPWDYTVEAEHLVSLIQRELLRLEAALSVFPEGFLETTAANFSKLRISLVRSLRGSMGVSSANGLQFFDGTDAHILLTPGAALERSLYHELYHVMETQILNESIALDQWDKLNPPGFYYDYDYAANASRDGSAYLTDESRSFIDTYSMSYPKEDRARILEYAATPGHAQLFQSPQMQAKLLKLCQGIREAYGLEKSGETFLWEQYLSPASGS